jgi:hypothetical protein
VAAGEIQIYGQALVIWIAPRCQTLALFLLLVVVVVMAVCTMRMSMKYQGS